MRNFLRRALFVTVACALAAMLLSAQDWNTADALPGVDLSGLTAAQQATVLRLLRSGACSCGCGMKLAECRTKDPSCSFSRGLSAVIVDAIRHGKTEKETLAAAAASPFAHPPGQSTRLLDNPVAIPTAGSPVTGPASAPITLVEFSDFQCPYCALAVPQIRALLKAYPSQVKLVFKEFPLETHPQAAIAAAAALAAQNQGKFWEMHDAMFANRDDLSRAALLGLAAKIGMDAKRFQADLDSASVHQTIARDLADGDRAGVEGTPTLFIDGQRYNGPITMEAVKPLLDAELKHPAKPAKTVVAALGGTR